MGDVICKDDLAAKLMELEQLARGEMRRADMLERECANLRVENLNLIHAAASEKTGRQYWEREVDRLREMKQAPEVTDLEQQLLHHREMQAKYQAALRRLRAENAALTERCNRLEVEKVRSESVTIDIASTY